MFTLKASRGEFYDELSAPSRQYNSGGNGALFEPSCQPHCSLTRTAPAAYFRVSGWLKQPPPWHICIRGWVCPLLLHDAKERWKRFGVCYTPSGARCVGWTVGSTPSSVRGKCARQPGPLSVNALEGTLNSGAFFQLLCASNSQSRLFFIFIRLFYEARARSTEGRQLIWLASYLISF